MNGKVRSAVLVTNDEELNMNSKNCSLEDSDTGDGNRILRRITPLSNWPNLPGEPHCKICVIDLETEGFDAQYHHILEFAGAMIEVDRQGRILSVEGPKGGFHDPGRPIERKIAELTGITDEMVAGVRLSPRKLADWIGQADACASFNAGFDRVHLEELVPEVGKMAWICAMADVNWRRLGFDGRAQAYLAMQAGLFNDNAHRATDDVETLVNLLSHGLDDGRTVLSHAMEGARAKTWRFEATQLPFRFKDDVKRRGYRFSGLNKVWHTLVREGEFDEELAWYRGLTGEDPSIVPVNAFERYRADWNWNSVKPKRHSLGG
ncbi:3'-5' exonuclease [Citromicrobium bathyomarinum]